MNALKLILRIIVLPIIAIPVIITGWVTMTFFGIGVVMGIMCVVALPFCWLVDSKEHTEDCYEGIGLLGCAFAYPFVWLWYFVVDTDKLKEIS